jgi:hypothetical protein
MLLDPEKQRLYDKRGEEGASCHSSTYKKETPYTEVGGKLPIFILHSFYFVYGKREKIPEPVENNNFF